MNDGTSRNEAMVTLLKLGCSFACFRIAPQGVVAVAMATNV